MSMTPRAYLLKHVKPIQARVDKEFAKEPWTVRAVLVKRAARPIQFASGAWSEEALATYFEEARAVVDLARRAVVDLHVQENGDVVMRDQAGVEALVAAYVELMLQPMVYWMDAGKEADEG